MNQEILDYIRSQKVGVLAVEMLDGSPHGATLHFSNSENPLVFYFKTSRKYRKSEALLGREITRATFVIGSDESKMKTLQVDGEARVIKTEEEEVFRSSYFGKFKEKKEKAEDLDAVKFILIPKWWRFTDWTKPEGKKIITSEDK